MVLVKKENKTEITSIRLDTELKKRLQRESTVNQITMNSLINQILAEHADWGRFGDQLGVMVVLRTFYKSLLDSVDTKTIVKLSKTVAKDDLRQLIHFIYGTVSINSIVEEIEHYLKRINVKYRHTTDNGSNVYHIYHDLGNNWSHYFITVVNSILEEIGYHVVQEVYRNGHFTIKIVKKKKK